MKPSIVGPAAWPANGPPPEFTVDSAGLPLYMVEVAAEPDLMASVAERTTENYFFGGEAESVFATGAHWRMPATVWAYLGHRSALFYRVITYDQSTGRSEPSTDDQHLDGLARVVIEHG